MPVSALSTTGDGYFFATKGCFGCASMLSSIPGLHMPGATSPPVVTIILSPDIVKCPLGWKVTLREELSFQALLNDSFEHHKTLSQQIVQLCTEGGTLSLKKHLHVSTFCFLNHVIMNILVHTPCAPGHAWPVQIEKPALGNSTRSSAFPSSLGRLMWWHWFFFWVENFETQRCEGMGQIVFPKWPQFLPAHMLFPMGPDCTPQKRWTQFLSLGLGWS